MEFYATCPAGFEPLLGHELRDLGIQGVRPLRGRVAFEDGLEAAYRACLWSRLASRVVLVLARGAAGSADELYETALAVDWTEHVAPGTTLAVFASGTNANLKNTQFTSLRVKDAISDSLLERAGFRVTTDPKQPDVSVQAQISHNRVTLGIDLAGDALTMRGHERSRHSTGLRADYAAALLTLAGWPGEGDDATPVLVEASTEPASIIVEAAAMVANRAPGLIRARWGFSGWKGHDAAAWERILEQARHAAGDATEARFLCSGATASRIAGVRSQLRAAGIDGDVQDLADAADVASAFVTCDLSAVTSEDLVAYAAVLARLRGLLQAVEPKGLACACRDGLATRCLALEERAGVESRLGRDPLRLVSFDTACAASPHEVTLPDQTSVPVLVGTSDQFVRRLAKNARLRRKWARREDVSCYRVYDADLPDYALTIDLFQETDPKTAELTGKRWLWVSEYAAPREVDPDLARARLMDALTLAARILDVSDTCVYLRVRRRDKGGSQYAQEGSRQVRSRRPGELPLGAHLIDEGGLAFEVNFTSRLDCGIFLDHRDTRAMIREMAKETKGSKRFLNLFAYTGTATCYAADGGARHTTTVDMSLPTLTWARRNMERNGFKGKEHEYVQADVVSWIQEMRHTANRWDLIFCDVPTFSNSSRMGRRSFDVQRDHVELLIGVSRLLTRDGRCVFSCNLRSFAPDTAALERAGVTIEDITASTIPEDFSRHARVHHAYVVTRTPKA